ncbi:antitoxin VbhA family protein [Promicromonospora xylanilytica]
MKPPPGSWSSPSRTHALHTGSCGHARGLPQRAERLRIVEAAMHNNTMEGLPVTDAARSDAVAFVSGNTSTSRPVSSATSSVPLRAPTISTSSAPSTMFDALVTRSP